MKVEPLAPATDDRLDCAKVSGAFAPCVDVDARSASDRSGPAGSSCSAQITPPLLPSSRLRGGPFHLHFCLKGDDRGIPSVHLSQYKPKTVDRRRDGRPGFTRPLEFDAATRLPALPRRARHLGAPSLHGRSARRSRPVATGVEPQPRCTCPERCHPGACSSRAEPRFRDARGLRPTARIWPFRCLPPPSGHRAGTGSRLRGTRKASPIQGEGQDSQNLRIR